MGHETCEGCDELGGVGACECTHLSLRWSSLWATKHVKGMPKWRGRIGAQPPEPSLELPMGHEKWGPPGCGHAWRIEPFNQKRYLWHWFHVCAVSKTNHQRSHQASQTIFVFRITRGPK